MAKVIEMEQPRGSCMQVLKEVQIRQWNYKTNEEEKVWKVITCDKVTDPGEELCPHHIMLLREFKAEQDRKMARARAGKERKARLRESLASSPLAVSQGSEGGYAQ